MENKTLPIIFNRSDLPWSIRILNYSTLLIILIWPLIFFGSIFIFDNPKNLFLTFLIFILINSYPFMIFGLIIMSFKLFKKCPLISIFIPITLLLGFISLLSLLLL
jgi:hypothetical protein